MDIVWKSRDGEYSVELSQSCLDEMIHLARKYEPLEIGTSLVGGYSDDGHTARIESLAPVAEDCQSFRYGFVSGIKGIQEFFRKTWNSSNGKRFYIGEWHSHPNGTTTPSEHDEESMMDISNDSEYQCSASILIILSITRNGFYVDASIFSRKNGKIELNRIS